MVWPHLQFVSVQRRRADQLGLGERVVICCLFPECFPVRDSNSRLRFKRTPIGQNKLSFSYSFSSQSTKFSATLAQPAGLLKNYTLSQKNRIKWIFIFCTHGQCKQRLFEQNLAKECKKWKLFKKNTNGRHFAHKGRGTPVIRKT